MRSDISYSRVENFIQIDLRKSTKNEGVYIDILSFIFLDKRIKLITVEPTKTSIGMDLEARENIYFNKTKVLINDIRHCSLKLIKDVYHSEDFQRGFLTFIVEADPIKVFLNDLDKFQKGKDNTLITLRSTAAFCQYDYDYLYLLNANVDKIDHFALV